MADVAGHDRIRNLHFEHVVVGGGIAGSECARQLLRARRDLKESVAQIAPDGVVSAAKDVRCYGRTIISFGIVSTLTTPATGDNDDQVHVICDTLHSINAKESMIYLKSGQTISYSTLALCTGALPLCPYDSEHVFLLRDSQSVQKLVTALRNCKKVILLGNGGIASELAYNIKNCDVVWVIRDETPSRRYIDCIGAEFFENVLANPNNEPNSIVQKRVRYDKVESEKTALKDCAAGQALGPDWHSSLELSGCLSEPGSVKLIKNAVVDKLSYDEKLKKYMVQLAGSNEALECDLVICGLGVQPNVAYLNPSDGICCDEDGIIINEQFQTSVANIFSAGDCTSTCRWPENDYWFRMRLWSQAYHMGSACAHAMAVYLNDASALASFTLPLPFELFTHVTQLFGFKLVLLGRYNALDDCPADDGPNDDVMTKRRERYRCLVRYNRGVDYAKLIVDTTTNRAVGAVLLGDTDLDETVENIIADRLDVASFEHVFLTADVDIEDYFD